MNMNINNNEENWKDIEGYDGLYQVSDKGRVKSLKFGKENLLKPRKTPKGYLQVHLCKNGETKWCYLHRLVAQSFLSNNNNLPQINHKNEDKIDNRVENLEWCDARYNNTYGTRTDKCLKPVIQYSKSGEFIKEWKSVTDVENELKIYHSNISACCRGKLKSAGGYVWKYKK